MTDEELQAIKARWPQYKPEMGIDSFGVARTDVLELVAEVERLRAELAAVPVANIRALAYYEDEHAVHTEMVREWLGGAE